jgi:hypothetical protein
VPTCITCGTELHPERAEKYAYCTADECQRGNGTGLTMVAVGVNKSSEQFEILDDRTRDEMAAGRFHDQRRASYGSLPATAGTRRPDSAARTTNAPARATTSATVETARTRVAPSPQQRRPWSVKQQRRAQLYHEQGLRPDEIARRLGVSRYLVTQMILAGKNRRSA